MEPAPKKSLGQHFLINPGICRKIIDLLAPAPQDQILEIGPGPGALTRFLLAAPYRRLLLIEKDSYWAGERGGEAEVLEQDALAFDWTALCEEGSWKLVGNLPYNIASPLIWDIVSKCGCYSRAVFMVQKEVGERLCAAPDSRLYGALSVWVQCHAAVHHAFTVGPGSFRPPPKVDSAVVLFTPLPGPEYPQKLQELLRICFQQRRKQLGGVFRRLGLPVLLKGLEALGLDAQLRAENLTCADFMNLARYWAEA